MSSHENPTPQPPEGLPDPVPSEQDHQIADDYENLSRREKLSRMLGGAASRFAAGDFMKGFQSHSVGLVGDNKRLEDGSPRMATTTDPLTGEDIKNPDFKMPIVPI